MNRSLLHSRFLYREMRHGWRHSIIFILCVALSLTTMSALNSFRDGVHRSLFQDARKLHGADIILHSHNELSASLSAMVETLEKEGAVLSSMTHEFYSVVRAPQQEQTLFAHIKVVDTKFPLYGRVDLASGKNVEEILQQGTALVAGDVLIRLGLKLGDLLQVGKAQLRLTDIVTYESESPVDILSFGPRVMVSAADLRQLDLVQKGSRVKFEMLLKVKDDAMLESIAAALKAVATPSQERVSTYKNAESRVKRFFDNLLFFLSLISIFTLLLAGLGMQSCLTALIRQKERTIAITRTVGATAAFLFRHYLLLVVAMGLGGSILGIICGAALGLYLPTLFEGLIPVNTAAALSLSGLGEGLVLGLMVVVLFTFLPLYRLRNIKPNAIFRNERKPMERGLVFYLAIATGVGMVTMLVIRQLEDKTIGLYFMAAVLLLIVIISLLAHFLLQAAAKLQTRRLALRQAQRSMVREGNATRSIIITLSSALSLLFAIYLVEHTLHATYVESYPQGAPSLFCLDIQPDQRQGFVSFFNEPPQMFPVIRARLTAINGTAINREEELSKKRDNFAREFNLTYRNELLDDEVIVKGASLFQKNDKGEVFLQVSVLDTIAELGDLALNDSLLFNIQGVEMEAKITSIRSRTKSKLYPFFYFVFPEQYLKDAPQTFFAALQYDRSKIATLESRILATYPNISFVNVAEAAEDIGAVMRKLSDIINFFAAFSILAGCLILVSSILATRMVRIRESVYYKILGAKTAFVFKIFIYENGLIGIFSALIALVLAHCGSWALCRYVFEIDYAPDLPASIILVVGTVVLVVIVGLLSSIAIVRQRPSHFLQEHSNG